MPERSAIRDGIRSHAAAAGFYLYALFAAPPLARALKAGLAEPEPLVWPGLLLLAVLFLEPFGLRWKLQFLRRRNAEESFAPQGSMLGIFSAAGIGHVLVTMFVGMIALDGWGAVGGGADESSVWWGAVIVALILKEFAGLLAGGGQSVSREAPGHWKEHAADALLGAYGCVAYTAWWGALLDVGALEWNSWGERLGLAPVFAAIFLFFYLPMRLPFLLDECYLRPARGRQARIWTELALGAALGLYPAFF